MDSPSQKLMILLALPLIAIFFASSAAAESKLVHELCNKTKDYPGCIAALEIDPRSAKATTELSLGEIALRIAEKNTTRSRKYVNKMLTDPKTRTSWKPVLKVCRDHFKTAAGQFLMASRELAIDIMSANYDVWMASHEIDACLAFMRSQKQDIPPLITRSTHAKAHVLVGLAVTKDA